MRDRLARLALGMAVFAACSFHPAVAQPFPNPIPVAEWTFLQDEAVSVLAAQGFPADKTPTFARSKIRAYVFGRLLGIIGKDAADRTPQEQAAYNRLRSAVQKNRAALAGNALQYWQSIADGDYCFSGGTGTIYVPPNLLVSLICELFQEPRPNQREVYRGQGATELYGQLLTRNGAVELSAMLAGMDWFAGRAAVEGGRLFQADSQAEKDYQGAMSVFRTIRSKEQTTFLLSLINPALGPVEVVRAVLVLGTAVWDVVDFAVIGNDLGAAAAAAGTADPNLASAVNGQLTELALVFMGETLRRAPPPTIDIQPSTRPCSFNGKYTCQHWAIRTDDPDFVAERYAGLSLPDPEPGSYFALKKQAAGAWQASFDLSPRLLDGSGILPWAVKLANDAANLNGELNGSSTRRQEPLPNGVNDPNELRISKAFGLAVQVADGFLVQTPTDGGPDWKYGTTLKYKNWQGEWWEARRMGNTFLHVRNGVELSGFAQVGGFVQNDGGLIIQDGAYTDGYKYCKAWKRGEGGYHAPPYRNDGKVDGQCILLAKDFDASRLSVGDRIEIGGQARTITGKVNCEGESLNNTGPLIDLFIGQLRCDESDGNFALDPATTNWNRTALVVDPPLQQLVGDYGPSAWLAIRKIADVDTCARVTTGITSFRCGPVFDPNDYDRHDIAYCPSFGAPIVGDSSLRGDPLPEAIFDDAIWANQYAGLDCFYSPMVRYLSTKDDQWSALYLPPAQARDDAYTLVDPGLVVPYSNGVIMNDNIPSSASITDKSGYRVTLTRDVAHGALALNDDGSFVYTRGLAGAGDPYCGPTGSPYCGPDSFAYEVCADRDGRTDCDTAEVELTVANEPPRAFDVAFELTGGKYVASYTYWDPEGDPEQGTSFAWTWKDSYFQTHVTTTATNELTPDPTLQSVVKVEVTPMASRGSWPDAPLAYGSDQSWALEYGIGMECTPSYLPLNGQTTCVFSPWANRPYEVSMPFDLVLGTLSAAWEFAPDDCHFDTIVGTDGIGTQTCTATLKLRDGFTDSGNAITATRSIWLGGGYGVGTRVYTNGTVLARAAAPTTLPISASAIPANGGSANCAPNPVSSGGDTSCVASANPGWKFAGWSGACTGVVATCDLHHVTAAKSVTANFLPTVSTAVLPAGGGTVSCTPGAVQLGGSTACIATPGAGYAFGAWSGDCTGPNPKCELAAVTDAKAVTASFIEVYPTADGTKNPVPWTQVTGGSGWKFASAADPGHPTLGWVPVSGSPRSPPVPPPPGVSLIYPLVLDFVLEGGAPGSTAQVTITYPDPIPTGAQYWKYDRVKGIWYALDPARYSFSGNTVTLTLTDGGAGDNDGAANGVIVDPGAPVMVTVPVVEEVDRPIPTLNEWTLLALMAMLALLGSRRQRRMRAS